MIRTASFTATSAAVLLTLAAAPALAAAPPVVVSVEPASGGVQSYFRLRARPGATVHAGRLLLRNRTRRRVRVLLDPVDAETAGTLGSAYRVRGLRIHGPTRWTRLPARRLSLGPRAHRAVPVSVRIPPGARAGDHLSGIGVQADERPAETKLRSNVAIASVHRYVIGVQVRVPGPRHPRIELTGARVERQPSGLVFLVGARNTGNVILQGVTGRVRVLRGGRQVAQAAIEPGTFVSGTAIDYPVAAGRETPTEGTDYRVQATMRYPGRTARLDEVVRFGAREARAQERFGGPAARRPARSGSDVGGVPLALIGGAGGLLAAGLLAGAALRRRRRRPAGIEPL